MSLSAENFKKAIDILKKEFLNIDLVLERHMKRLTSTPAPKYNDYDGIRRFLNNFRASVYEFETLGFGIQPNTFGDKLLSFLIMGKLSGNFKTRCSLTLGTDFPSCEMIINNYNDIIASLERTYPSPSTSSGIKERNSNEKRNNNIDIKPVQQNPPATLQAFSTSENQERKSKGKKKDFKKKFEPKECRMCQDSSEGFTNSLPSV